MDRADLIARVGHYLGPFSMGLCRLFCKKIVNCSFGARMLRYAVILISTLALSGSFATAEEDQQESASADETVFVPPDVGAPAERMGAGTRDVATSNEMVRLLVPEGGGLTTSGKPRLVWQLRNGFRGNMRAEISASGADGVVLDRNGAFPEGFYGLDLQRSDLSLEIGIIYVWRVLLQNEDAVVALTQSFVERVDATDADPGQAGVWFDVLDPLVSIDLSGRVRSSDKAALNHLLQAGGVLE